MSSLEGGFAFDLPTAPVQPVQPVDETPVEPDQAEQPGQVPHVDMDDESLAVPHFEQPNVVSTVNDNAQASTSAAAIDGNANVADPGSNGMNSKG